MPLPPPAPGRCYVQIHGNPADLEYLELLVPIYGGEMAVQASNTLLHAPSFDDSNALQAQGRAFLDRINHAAMVTLDRSLGIEIGASWTPNAGGWMVHVIAELGISATMSVRIANGDDATALRYPEDQLLFLARSAASRRQLDTALRLYANQGTTWHGLYKVIEALQDAVGGLSSAGFCTRAELDRVTRTANNFQALGDDARHVKSASPKPANPATLEEARQFVRRMLQQALTTTIAEKPRG